MTGPRGEFAEERAWWVARGFKDPLKAYKTHMAGARRRGIEFQLTFAEWWELWAPHYPDRGPGRKVMCRTGDVGAYAVGNVRIDWSASNVQESVAARKANGTYVPPRGNPGRRRPPPGVGSDWICQRPYGKPSLQYEELD